jgi:hypothetical protein
MFTILKNGEIYAETKTCIEDAQWELEFIARSWRRNGGIVIEHSEYTLIVCEENGEDEQIFTII